MASAPIARLCPEERGRDYAHERDEPSDDDVVHHTPLSSFTVTRVEEFFKIPVYIDLYTKNGIVLLDL